MPSLIQKVAVRIKWDHSGEGTVPSADKISAAVREVLDDYINQTDFRREVENLLANEYSGMEYGALEVDSVLVTRAKKVAKRRGKKKASEQLRRNKKTSKRRTKKKAARKPSEVIQKRNLWEALRGK